MSWVLVCRGRPSGHPSPFDGMYLEWYNPDADKTGPVGGWTPMLPLAMRFSGPDTALDLWRSPRLVDGGCRPDGEPDRPLTAFNVEAVFVDEE